MSNIGIFIGEEHIGTLEPFTTEASTEVTSREVRIMEMEYYMRRKNKVFLRDKAGQKIDFTCEQLPEDILTMKYGTIVTCRFEIA